MGMKHFIQSHKHGIGIELATEGQEPKLHQGTF